MKNWKMLLKRYIINLSVLFSLLKYSKVSEIERKMKYNRPYMLLSLGFIIFENFSLAPENLKWNLLFFPEALSGWAIEWLDTVPGTRVVLLQPAERGFPQSSALCGRCYTSSSQPVGGDPPPQGVEWPLHKGHLLDSISDIFITIHNGGKNDSYEVAMK